jgi:excisionase family DNA binding protein
MPKRINKIKFYLVEEIQDILGLTRETVTKYIHQGRIHAIKIGSSWHISNESLNEFLKTGGVRDQKVGPRGD